MPNLPCILIDPHLVVLPDPCQSTTQIESFIEGLLAWSESLTRKDMAIFISDKCINGLYDDGWYPYVGRITPLLKQFAVEIADEETINNLVRSVFDKTPRLEEYLGIDDILYDENVSIISPDIFINRLKNETAKGLRDSLIMALVGQDYLMSVTKGCLFAAGPCAEVEPNSELLIRAYIQILLTIENNPNNPISETDFPLSLEGSLTICFGHNEAMQQIGALNLWGDAALEARAIDAIRTTMSKHRAVGLPIDKGEYPFRLGHKFLESVRTYGFGARSDLAVILIESCARILLKIPKEQVKEFRTDKSPQAPQLVRKADGALAWRTHLTKSGAGFRLMFWETPDGIIEFSNVGPKSELVIYE